MNDNYDNQLRKCFKNKNVNICITKQTYFDQNTNDLDSLNVAPNNNIEGTFNCNNKIEMNRKMHKT